MRDQNEQAWKYTVPYYLGRGIDELQRLAQLPLDYNELTVIHLAIYCLENGRDQYADLFPSGARPSFTWMKDRFSNKLTTVTKNVHDSFVDKFCSNRNTKTLEDAYSAHVATAAAHQIARLPSPSQLRHKSGRTLPPFAALKDCVTIGKQQTLWVRLTGNGERDQEIRRELAECTLDPDIRPIYDRAAGEIVGNVRRDFITGILRPKIENNSMAMLARIDHWPFAGVNEDRRLNLLFGVNEYIDFFSLVKSADGRLYQRQRLLPWVVSDGPTLANSMGVGVNVAIVTADNRFATGIRNSTQAVRAEGVDIGAVEGLMLSKDFASHKMNLYDAMERAVQEEYAIERDQIKNLYLLGFGCDLQYGQWNALGVCYTAKNATQTEIDRVLSARDRVENKEVFYPRAEPDELFSDLRRQCVWSCGLATAYYTMVHMHGRPAVDLALQNFVMDDKDQYSE